MVYTYSLKKPHEFRRAYSKGKSASNKCFVVYVRKNGKNVTRLGITVSAKLGNAVHRNRIRRRIRECYRVNESSFPKGFDIVVVARGYSETASFQDLSRALSGCVRKAVQSAAYYENGN